MPRDNPALPTVPRAFYPLPMPYAWTDPHDTDPAPEWHLTLWPHRSLSRQGFVVFIAVTFGMLMIPILSVLGTVVLWVLLPFVLGALALTWAFIQRSYRDGTLREDLVLTSTDITLTRRNPRRPDQHWAANTYWVRVYLHETGGRVEKYLTLKGSDREVELGAFLSPEERQLLYGEVLERLARARRIAQKEGPDR